MSDSSRSTGEQAVNRLADEETEKVAARWGQEPDPAVNWATIPHVDRRAAEMIADPAKGYWGHMLDLYRIPIAPCAPGLRGDRGEE